MNERMLEKVAISENNLGHPGDTDSNVYIFTIVSFPFLHSHSTGGIGYIAKYEK